MVFWMVYLHVCIHMCFLLSIADAATIHPSTTNNNLSLTPAITSLTSPSPSPSLEATYHTQTNNHIRNLFTDKSVVTLYYCLLTTNVHYLYKLLYLLPPFTEKLPPSTTLYRQVNFLLSSFHPVHPCKQPPLLHITPHSLHNSHSTALHFTTSLELENSNWIDALVYSTWLLSPCIE